MPDSFFGEVLRIGTPGYLPNNADVLRARQKSVGITETRFDMGQLSYVFSFFLLSFGNVLCLLPSFLLCYLLYSGACTDMVLMNIYSQNTHVRCRRPTIGEEKMDMLFRIGDIYHFLHSAERV